MVKHGLCGEELSLCALNHGPVAAERPAQAGELIARLTIATRGSINALGCDVNCDAGSRFMAQR